MSRNLFVKCFELDESLLQLLETKIDIILKEYNPVLNYHIEYDIDPEESIGYLIIRSDNIGSIDEEISINKHLWKQLKQDRKCREILNRLNVLIFKD